MSQHKTTNILVQAAATSLVSVRLNIVFVLLLVLVLLIASGGPP